MTRWFQSMVACGVLLMAMPPVLADPACKPVVGHFEAVVVPLDNANDLPQRAQSLAGRVDAIYQIQSNLVQTSIPVLAQVARRSRVPLFNSVYSDKLKHQLAGFHAVSYDKNGAHAADIADRILKGEKPATIAPYVPKPEDFDSLVSEQGLKAVGLSLPAALKGSAWLIP